MSAVRSAEAPVVRESAPSNGAVLHLENGELADQPTFHAWYRTTKEGFKAELIDGVVVVSSPVSARHGRPHGNVMGVLAMYAFATPGVYTIDNTTAILSNRSEPQPDAALLIEPEWGGQARVDEEEYIVGPPELVVEVANSSASIDMNRKRSDYERAGVAEYLVVLIRDRQVRWYVRHDGEFVDLPPMPDGSYRSRIFPGLWLNADALMRRDHMALSSTLQAGLASPEHAEFVRLMESRRPQAKE